MWAQLTAVPCNALAHALILSDCCFGPTTLEVWRSYAQSLLELYFPRQCAASRLPLTSELGCRVMPTLSWRLSMRSSTSLGRPPR